MNNRDIRKLEDKDLEEINQIKKDFEEKEKELGKESWGLKIPGQDYSDYFKETGKEYRIEVRVLGELMEMLRNSKDKQEIEVLKNVFKNSGIYEVVWNHDTDKEQSIVTDEEKKRREGKVGEIDLIGG